MNRASEYNSGEIGQLGVALVDGRAHVRVWAPEAKSVMVHVVETDVKVFLEAQDYGYWYAESEELEAGQRYWVVLDGEPYPDPASRSQPEGVHGPSAVEDLAFDWTDGSYVSPALRDLIIYELHVGTFSTSGDFQGVIERLPYLKDLGVTAVELMPVGQFPGDRNWGYDGVYGFAVQHSYGGAAGLQQLVDAAHSHGIAVILDVVYNHFGPEGNYLPEFGPYLTDKYQTPWGKALNYDDAWSNGMRDYACENVRMWFRDFHIDGLRLDAVHAIKDFSARHILQDLRQVADEWTQQKAVVNRSAAVNKVAAVNRRASRQHFLIVECDLNDRRFLEPLDRNGFGMDTQWLDEFHHALRTAAGGDRTGYYSEFEGVKHLAKAYESAYVFDGNYSSHRRKFFGSSAKGLAGECFVVFSQNHDQVGNRMLGERSSVLFSREMQRLMAMAVMVSPFLPLLFMGEEWACRKPFQYFISHGDEELIQAVREGRQREFAEFFSQDDVENSGNHHSNHMVDRAQTGFMNDSIGAGSDNASGSRSNSNKFPDPQEEESFEECVLDWNELENDEHRQMLDYYRELIALRKNHPLLRDLQREDVRVQCFPEKNSIILLLKQQLLCIMNFSQSAIFTLRPDVLTFFQDNDPLYDRDFLQNSDLSCTKSPWRKIWDSAGSATQGVTEMTLSEEITMDPQSGIILEKNG